jgi:quinohemoprotein ethanol dehydrogenase
MILTRMMIDGEQRPVVIHAPKNGFLYVLDRRDGKLLRANRLVRTNWATSVDAKTGRPAMDSTAADYGQSPKIVFPATPGARNWHPASFDAASGLYYASVLDMGNLIFTTPGKKPFVRRMLNNDAALIFRYRPRGGAAHAAAAASGSGEGATRIRGSEARAVRLGVARHRSADRADRWAVPTKGWQDRSGVLTTASGLLFLGSIDGHFHVFDKRDGRRLKSIDTGSSILAAPMTYRVKWRAVRGGDGGLGRRRLSVRAALLGRLPARQSGTNSHIQIGWRRGTHPAGAAAARTRTARARAGAISSPPRRSSGAARSSSATACCVIRTSTDP